MYLLPLDSVNNPMQGTCIGLLSMAAAAAAAALLLGFELRPGRADAIVPCVEAINN
jgi:hypothetical protein